MKKQIKDLKKNMVMGSTNEQGVWVEDSKAINEVVFHNYYSGLFYSEVSQGLDAFENYIESRVSNDMNKLLVSPFTKEELHKASFQMGLFNRLGPNGMPALFYQRYWSIIVHDGMDCTCLRVLNRTRGLMGLNKTLITLVPKTNSRRRVTKFRPIT